MNTFKTNLLIIPLVFGLNSCDQNNISDEFLQVNTQKIETKCECHNAIILFRKEEIAIFEKLATGNCTSADSVFLNEEHLKRLDKHVEIFNHCRPIYNRSRGDYCENEDEVEALGRKLSELRGY